VGDAIGVTVALWGVLSAQGGVNPPLAVATLEICPTSLVQTEHGNFRIVGQGGVGLGWTLLLTSKRRRMSKRGRAKKGRVVVNAKSCDWSVDG